MKVLKYILSGENRTLAAAKAGVRSEIRLHYHKSHKIRRQNRSVAKACCKGKINSAYGYIWRYKKEKDYPLHINVSNNDRTQFHKTVLQFSKERNLIATYNSILKASSTTGIKRRAISNCLYGWSKSAGGYVWKFQEEMEEVA